VSIVPWNRLPISEQRDLEARIGALLKTGVFMKDIAAAVGVTLERVRIVDSRQRAREVAGMKACPSCGGRGFVPAHESEACS
jgi:hypothetical protein